MTTFFEGIGAPREIGRRTRRRRRRDREKRAGALDSYFDSLKVLEAGAKTKSYFGEPACVAELKEHVEWVIATEDRIHRADDDRLERRNKRRLLVALVSVQLGLAVLAGCTIAGSAVILLGHIDDPHEALIRGPALYVPGISLGIAGVGRIVLKRLVQELRVDNAELQADVVARLE